MATAMVSTGLSALPRTLITNCSAPRGWKAMRRAPISVTGDGAPGTRPATSSAAPSATPPASRPAVAARSADRTRITRIEQQFSACRMTRI